MVAMHRFGLLASVIAGPACAGTVLLPSDVSVRLSADITTNLSPGDRPTFTISVTNHGPDPLGGPSANGVVVTSSPIYDELDIASASANGCDYDLVLSVVDLENSFYFRFSFFAAHPTRVLAVGETRTCQLSLDYTPWAPPVFPVTFALNGFETDPDTSNNAATVELVRAPSAAAPIPVTTWPWSLLLVSGLAILARQGRSMGSPRRTALPRRRWA